MPKYLERIGIGGTPRPDIETWSAIQSGHSSSIPFENLDVLQGLPILLDPASIEDKIVNRRRGGYCFEQNGLLLEILGEIGFDVKPLSARVRIGLERSQVPARTHMFVLATVDGTSWIVDGGFGGFSLTAPIKVELGLEQTTPHETRRITEENGVLYHQVLIQGDWKDVCEFTGEEMPLVDRELSNWWTSTCPKSKFKQGVYCGLARSNGERIGLLDGRFTRRRGAEILQTIEIESDSALLEILNSEFGLCLPAGTSFGGYGSAQPALT